LDRLVFLVAGINWASFAPENRASRASGAVPVQPRRAGVERRSSKPRVAGSSPARGIGEKRRYAENACKAQIRPMRLAVRCEHMRGNAPRTNILVASWSHIGPEVRVGALSLGVAISCQLTRLPEGTLASAGINRPEGSCKSSWLLRKDAGGVVVLDAEPAGERRRPGVVPTGLSQAVAGAFWLRWSLSRLCVAVISRHSDLQAALPRRKKRSMRRLNLVFANTGSIVVCRLP
jgi:hypothetical protein